MSRKKLKEEMVVQRHYGFTIEKWEKLVISCSIQLHLKIDKSQVQFSSYILQTVYASVVEHELQKN